MLDRLYDEFDVLADNHGVFKVVHLCLRDLLLITSFAPDETITPILSVCHTIYHC